MKDVAGCDKPRGGVKHPLIRGFPNGETQRGKPALSRRMTGRAPGELKHLSSRRKRNQKKLRFSTINNQHATSWLSTINFMLVVGSWMLIVGEAGIPKVVASEMGRA